MRRQLAVFFLLYTALSFAQEVNDIKEADAKLNNTLEIVGFSVPVKVVDSLIVTNDSITVEVIQPISQKDSIRFLNFSLPKLGILKNVVVKTLEEKDVDSLPKRFEIMNRVNLDHDSRLLSVKLFTQLLDSFSIERTQYKLRLVELRKVVQKPIKEMSEITVEDYKIFYSDGTEKHLDTTLNINKDYRFNYLRKDYFEVLTFPNTGEGFNKLGYDFQREKKTPQIGARGKHFAYMEEEETPYFEVPTPMTELFFKSVFEQGQMVDALITVNTSPRFNLSVAHKAYRSLGRYINTLGGGTNLRFTTNYTSKNYRYRQRSHFVAQRLENQANGGLDSLSVYYFEKAIEEFDYDGFLDRSRLNNNVEVENTLVGRRYYLDQQYDLIIGGNNKMYNYERPKRLTVGHKINYEIKQFNYDNSEFDLKGFFGTASGTSRYNVSNRLDTMENELYAIFNDKKLGQIKAGMRIFNWNYFIIFPSDEAEDGPVDRGPYPTSIKANQFALDTYWKKTFLKFDFKAEGYISIKKEYATQFMSGTLSKRFKNDLFIQTKFSLRNQTPNFNFFLHRSNFIEYDWYNPSFKNQQINTLEFKLSHQIWGDLQGKYELINNYTYFRNLLPFKRMISFLESTNKVEEELLVTPEQSENQINYLKLRWNKQINLGKFSLANTVQYQQVSQNEAEDGFNPINVPEWNVRSSLFFSSQLFGKALFLQTGITAQYFTKYFGDRYSPVIGEFVSQNHTEIGDFPRIDFFINAKIQQTRLFLKFEHINDDNTGYNYYSAPFTPYRDSILRFGIVWNFFQ